MRFVFIEAMRRLTSMALLSIVALNMIDRISRTILFIYERCSSACARISCILMHRNESSVLKRFLFSTASLRSEVCKRISGKVKAIVDWLVLQSQKKLLKWLSLANYLHKYSANYADMASPLYNLLKKDVDWCWHAEHDNASKSIKERLLTVPILALLDPDRPFSVVCDTSKFVICPKQMQKGVSV